MTAKLIYTDDNIGPATAVETTWSPVAGDVNQLDLGPARFLRTTQGQFTLSFDAAGLGANSAVIVLEIISIPPAVTLSIQKAASVPAAFPAIAGQIQWSPHYPAAIALHGITTPAPDSAGISVSFAGSGNVVFDIHAIAPLRAWELPEEIDTDWTVRYVDLSDVATADAGRTFSQRRRIVRELVARLRNRDEETVILPEDQEGLIRILRRTGRSRPLMLIPRDLGEQIDPEIAVFGFLRNDPEVNHEDGPFYSLSELIIREDA